MFEGIAVSAVNSFVLEAVRILQNYQQQYGVEETVFELQNAITSYNIAYFVLAYIVPLIFAYRWAGKAGVLVYSISWLGVSMTLNDSFTLGMYLLVGTCFLAILVDLVVNQEHGGQGHPPRPPV